MPVSPDVHPESEGRIKGLLTIGTGLASPPTELLTVVWLEALLPAAAPALMAPSIPAIAASILANCVLEATELVIEARAWRPSSLCAGFGEARVRVEQLRKISQRRMAPLKEELGLILYTLSRSLTCSIEFRHS